MTPEEEEALRAENAALREQAPVAEVQELKWPLAMALMDSHNCSKPPTQRWAETQTQEPAAEVRQGARGTAGASWPSDVACGA
jgi:hypothetical protein